MNVVQRYNSYWREKICTKGCLKKYVDVVENLKIPSKQDLKTEMEIIGQEANLSVNESDVDIVMNYLRKQNLVFQCQYPPTNNVEENDDRRDKNRKSKKIGNGK